MRDKLHCAFLLRRSCCKSKMGRLAHTGVPTVHCVLKGVLVQSCWESGSEHLLTGSWTAENLCWLNSRHVEGKNYPLNCYLQSWKKMFYGNFITSWCMSIPTWKTWITNLIPADYGILGVVDQESNFSKFWSIPVHLHQCCLLPPVIRQVEA